MSGPTHLPGEFSSAVYLFPNGQYRALVAGTTRMTLCCESGHHTPEDAADCGIALVSAALRRSATRWLKESPHD